MTTDVDAIEFVSLFAGVDGTGLAWERLGMVCTLQVENDPHCLTILNRHFPHVPKRGDITHVHASDIPGRPRIVAVTFPCQDTSIAAPSRAGLAGGRSSKFFDAIRILVELRDEGRAPEWVFFENPEGILKSNDRADFATVQRFLADVGYVGGWRVVDSQHLGTPQRRRRVLMVGHLGDDPGPAWEVLGDPGDSGQAAAPRAKRSAWPSGPVPALPAGITRLWRKSARPRASLAAGGYETWVWDGQANTLTGFDYGDAARQVHLVAHDMVPAFGTPAMRTFTLTEWERLNGVPDGWTEGVPESARATQLGNMHTVFSADWLGRRFLSAIARSES